jgi:hypothetical protein
LKRSEEQVYFEYNYSIMNTTLYWIGK